MVTRPRILYVANAAWYFVAHRLHFASAARNAGYEVHVAAHDDPASEQIRAAGLSFHPVSISRKGIRPGEELASLGALYRLYQRLRPDLVHHVTIKPVLYGGIAARLAGVPAVVSSVSGLGYVFTATDRKASVLRPLVEIGYKASFMHPNVRVIFENPDDCALFIRSGILSADRVQVIRGIGVDTNRFRPALRPRGAPIVLLAARMLWDKGIGEFVEAASILRSRGVDARFVLIGKLDEGNPAAVPVSRINQWCDSGVIEWWGHSGDMPAVFSAAHIACLPSYREGLPTVLSEAAASGLPIVTTDVPGCREVVRHGYNGLLVPPRNVPALTEALSVLIHDPELREQMGACGREVVVQELAVERVVEETLAAYTRQLCASPRAHRDASASDSAVTTAKSSTSSG